MQVILTEAEYTDLKKLAGKADNYEKLYNELMSQHLALKDEHAKLLVFSVSSNNEKLEHKEVFVFKEIFRIMLI